MATFDLPLTVRVNETDIPLVLRSTAGVKLGEALPEILGAAGLPATATLFWGLAPVDPLWVLGHGILIAGVCLSDRRQDIPLTIATVLGLACVAGPDAGRTEPLEPGELTIGRDAAADFVIDDPQLSRMHAVVTVDSLGVGIQNLNSLNGIRIDGKCQDAAAGLETGQLIEVGASLLQTRLMCPPIAVLATDAEGHLAVLRSARVKGNWRTPDLRAIGEAPVRNRKPLPMMAAVMAGILGVGIAVITGYWMVLLLAALGPLMMITNAISDRIGGRKSHRRLTSQYALDAADHQLRLTAICDADLTDSWDCNPDPATILQYAQRPSARLWERGRTGPDWLHLRLGVGYRPARISGTPPPLVGPAPVVLDLATTGVAGICGDGRGLLRCLIAQAAVLHSPAQLRILIFSAEPDLAAAYGLPHAGPSPGELGTVITTDAAAVDALALLASAPPSQDTLLIFDAASRWRAISRVAETLLSCLDPKSGLSAICLESDSRRLPHECGTVIDIDSTAGTLRVRSPSGVRVGTADGISDRCLESIIRSLVPLTDPDITANAMPRLLGLADLGVGLTGTEADAELVRARWRLPGAHALLGSAGAKVITLDLDEDGPHFLIAGTTGSGKSELLQTLVATLALAAPPQLMSFLLMDYKGGAAFAEAAQLPHTTGLVTDLDPGSAARVLTSLRAELHAREKQLAAAGLPDLAALQRLVGTQCPPRLIIVVDEFAALSTDLPDFMTGLVDISQRGRSLGVHLVLATQRPAGVVSPAIKANITGRICLRVTDDHDSADVIDSPLAAAIPRTSPGRAYLRTGKGQITAFQTARVAGPWEPPDSTVIQVHRRRPDGRIPQSADPPNSDPPGGTTVLQVLVRACRAAAAGLPPIRRPWLPALPTKLTSAAAIAAAFASNVGSQGAAGLTLAAAADSSPAAVAGSSLAAGSGSSLAAAIAADFAAAVGFTQPGAAPGREPDSHTAGSAIVGLIDLPSQGRQELLLAPRGSVMFWGAAGSGRSCALRTIGRANLLSAPDTEIAVVDPAGTLFHLRTWTSCTTYLDGHDPWLVARLSERLAQEMAARTTFGEGHDGRAELEQRPPRPHLLILIDGWESCVSMLDAQDFGAASARFLELAIRGPAVGIFVATTADSRIQHSRAAAAFALRIELGPPDAPSTGSSRLISSPDSTGGSAAEIGTQGWPPGRGRLASGHAVQLVLDSPGPPAPTPMLEGKGGGTVVIRELPGTVTSEELPTSIPESLYWSLGGDDGQPIGLNSTLGQVSLLVAGPRRSGVTTALATFTAAALSCGVPVLQIVRIPITPAPAGLRQVSTRDGPAELESAFARHEGPLLVIADDGHELHETPAGAVLAKFLQFAGPGQNLILGVRADRLGRSYRGLIADLAAMRRGVLLQPDGQDGAAFDLQLPRRRRPGPPGRGLLADCGLAIPVQVALHRAPTPRTNPLRQLA